MAFTSKFTQDYVFDEPILSGGLLEEDIIFISIGGSDKREFQIPEYLLNRATFHGKVRSVLFGNMLGNSEAVRTLPLYRVTQGMWKMSETDKYNAVRLEVKGQFNYDHDVQGLVELSRQISKSKKVLLVADFSGLGLAEIAWCEAGGSYSNKIMFFRREDWSAISLVIALLGIFQDIDGSYMFGRGPVERRLCRQILDAISARKKNEAIKSFGELSEHGGNILVRRGDLFELLRQRSDKVTSEAGLADTWSSILWDISRFTDALKAILEALHEPTHFVSNNWDMIHSAMEGLRKSVEQFPSWEVNAKKLITRVKEYYDHNIQIARESVEKALLAV